MIMMLAKLQRTFHDTALGGTDEIHDFVGREEFNFGNHKVTNFTAVSYTHLDVYKRQP